MPTFGWLPRFGADFDQLTSAQQAAFLATVAQFVEDLRLGRQFRRSIRVNGVQGAPRVFEMTWAPNRRATFRFGEPLRDGEPHVIWRRVGTHAIFRQP